MAQVGKALVGRAVEDRLGVLASSAKLKDAAADPPAKPLFGLVSSYLSAPAWCRWWGEDRKDSRRVAGSRAAGRLPDGIRSRQAGREQGILGQLATSGEFIMLATNCSVVMPRPGPQSTH